MRTMRRHGGLLEIFSSKQGTVSFYFKNKIFKNGFARPVGAASIAYARSIETN